MPARKNLQQQRNEQTDALREVLAEFQQDLRDVLRQSVETAVRTIIQATQQPGALPQRDAPIFDEEVEEDENDNPFAVDDEPLIQQLRQAPVADRGFDNRRWESGFQLDLPDFHGTLQPEELLDWISSTEELLTFKGVPENMRVPLVATRFKGQASAWWQQVKEQRSRAGQKDL